MILGQEIKVLKDTPWRVRVKRKEYQKLVKCLRQNQIQYWWLILEGIFFKIQGKRHKINSVMKVEEFLRRNKHLWQEEGEEVDKEEEEELEDSEEEEEMGKELRRKIEEEK